MRARQPLSWLLEGEGELHSGLNRIHGSKIKGEEVVLKYHWAGELVANPPMTILPEKILDDPIPFIKLINPPFQFTLRIGG